MSVTMRSLVFVFLAIPQVFTFIAEPTPNLWDLFKAKHRKNYLSTLEETQRKAIFHENVKFIRAHNEMFEKGKVNFTMAVNRFADLTTKEFLATMTGLRLPRVQCKGSEENQNLTETLGLPSEVDWRKKGAVTAVKDQGQCGSCWAFSTTGSLEGAHFLKTKKLVSLSEQNLVDCDRNDSGCSGGLMDNAFKYIKNNHGIDTEEAYPYTAMDGQCHFNPKSVGATVTGFVDLPCGSEGKLMATVANSGPVSIGIDASLNFQFYSGGVLNDHSCSSVDLNHGVLAVGYGTDPKGGDYWLVKNSWGTSWGMQGYIKMSRNKHNQCGVASAASYPTV